MIGLKQLLSDLKLILLTDRRIWASAAFVAVAMIVWTTTGTWRNLEQPLPERYGRLKLEEEKKLKSLVKEFNKSMEESQEERKVLRDYLDRVTHEVKIGKEEINWHLNILVNKLDAMTDKVDGITGEVGQASLERDKMKKRMAQGQGQAKKSKSSAPDILY